MSLTCRLTVCAYDQIGSDLLVRGSGGEQAQHLELASREHGRHGGAVRVEAGQIRGGR
jgi:hypothetical protein